MIKQKVLPLLALSVVAAINYVDAFAPPMILRQQHSCRHDDVTQTNRYRSSHIPCNSLHHLQGVFKKPSLITAGNSPPPRHSMVLHSTTGGFIQEIVTAVFRWDIGQVPFLGALGINALLFATLSSKLFTMLTPSGFYNALFLGTMLWTTLGWRGWVYCVLYLFFGQAVTKVRFQEKESKGLAEGRGGRRGPENVWGSAATGLFCAICATQQAGFASFMSTDLFLLAYVASLATKLADTFASEIGKAYGKTTFLITNFSRVEPGTEGAVSVEGTAAAMLGGLVLSLCGWALGFITLPAVALSTLAAFVATNVESLLGATLQEKEGLEWITNEVINFFNTAIGAALAVVMGKVLLGM